MSLHDESPKVLSLAKEALKEFDYPTRDAAVKAREMLASAIMETIDKWIEAHCQF